MPSVVTKLTVAVLAKRTGDVRVYNFRCDFTFEHLDLHRVVTTYAKGP